MSHKTHVPRVFQQFDFRFCWQSSDLRLSDSIPRLKIIQHESQHGNCFRRDIGLGTTTDLGIINVFGAARVLCTLHYGMLEIPTLLCFLHVRMHPALRNAANSLDYICMCVCVCLKTFLLTGWQDLPVTPPRCGSEFQNKRFCR